MANNSHHQKKIEQARQLLSPYLDGEVTTRERIFVEEALSANANLRAELDSLQTTVNLLENLPALVPPRAFTLSEADIPAEQTAPRFFVLPNWLKLWGTAAAGLLCVLTIGGVLFVQQFGGGMISAPAAEVAMMEEVAEPESAKSADIVPEKEIAAEAVPAMPEPLAAIEEEADAADEESVETEMAEVEAPSADDTFGAASAAESAPVEKTAPVPVPQEMAEIQADEELGLAQEGEAPLMSLAEDAGGGELPPHPGAEAPAAASPIEEENIPAEAPMPVDNAADNIGADELPAVESRGVAPAPTIEVSPLPTTTPTLTPSPAPTSTAETAAAPIETRNRISPALIFSAGLLAVLALGIGLWLIRRKHRR